MPFFFLLLLFFLFILLLLLLLFVLLLPLLPLPLPPIPPLPHPADSAVCAQLKALAGDLGSTDGAHPAADRGGASSHWLHLLSGRGLQVPRSLGQRVAGRTGCSHTSRSVNDAGPPAESTILIQAASNCTQGVCCHLQVSIPYRFSHGLNGAINIPKWPQHFSQQLQELSAPFQNA